MSYISEIRKKVGHNRILSVACGALLENEKEEILLQFRKDTRNFGVPGGNIELGEKVIDALIREVMEETGIVLSKESCKLFGIYSGEPLIMIYPNQDEVQYVNIIFHCKISSNAKIIPQDEESIFLKFYSKTSLPDNIKASDRLWIDAWAQGQKNIVVD